MSTTFMVDWKGAEMYQKRMVICAGIKHWAVDTQYPEPIPQFEWIVGEDESPFYYGWVCIRCKTPTIAGVSDLWFCPDCKRDAYRMSRAGGLWRLDLPYEVGWEVR